MTIPEALVLAYEETHYHVYSEPPFYLEVNKYSSALAALYKHYQVYTSAFITAWNPFSEQLSDVQNADRHQQLLKQTKDMDYQVIEGLGQHPSNKWPGEVSILVLGIPSFTAKELGEHFAQNAILFADEKAVSELVYHSKFGSS